VKVLYRQTASDDVVRQFRYYLLTADAPAIAVGFREAVRRTIESLTQNPHVGPRYPPAIRDFKIFAHGPSMDLKRFGFITLWRKTPCTLFVSSTANETSGGSFKANEYVSSKFASPRKRFSSYNGLANSDSTAWCSESVSYTRATCPVSVAKYARSCRLYLSECVHGPLRGHTKLCPHSYPHGLSHSFVHAEIRTLTIRHDVVMSKRNPRRTGKA
jgi:plasmid stabilization system protein ParE